VIGAGKRQLFWQFIGESLILCLLALVLSIVIAILILPSFNQFAEKQLQVQGLLSLPFILFTLLIVISVSFLAGSYPALMLTNFQPVKVLKGAFKNTGSGQSLRKSLIVFQFAISVFLIASTLVMQKQLYYIQNKKLGYEREHVLVLPMDGKMAESITLIKEEFKKDPGVINVSYCVRSPVEGGGGYNMRSATMPDNEEISVRANPVDQDYVKTTGMELVAGEDLTEQDIKDISGDNQDKKLYHFILNESAARKLGWSPQEAVGKKMFLDNSRPGFVKGVVKDFHFESLHNAIAPYVLFPEFRGREILVKLSGSHLPQTISFIESKWKRLVPYRPFEYRFMEDDYTKLYNGEIRLGSIMNLFASVAIVLACLGLFGLSAYSTKQRVKEIGIRKILGATVSNIVMALSKDFIILSLVAILIAVPLAWWAMAKWMQGFIYRAETGWSIYLIAGAIAIFLAFATVSIHAIKAAISNPVKSLRTE